LIFVFCLIVFELFHSSCTLPTKLLIAGVFTPKKKLGQGSTSRASALESRMIIDFLEPRKIFCSTNTTPHRLIVGVLGQGHQNLGKRVSTLEIRMIFTFLKPRTIFCDTDAMHHRLIAGVSPPPKETGAVASTSEKTKRQIWSP